MIASRHISPEQMLAGIPSLPRPMLARLVDHMIDRLDELDGDADEEDNGDAEPIDKREPEEEFWAVAGSPVTRLRVSALPQHCASPIPPGWRLSISTQTTLLAITRGATQYRT